MSVYLHGQYYEKPFYRRDIYVLTVINVKITDSSMWQRHNTGRSDTMTVLSSEKNEKKPKHFVE